MAITLIAKWTYELITEEKIEKTYGNYDIYILELAEACIKDVISF